MANNSDNVNLKRLIDIGKDKGYITYEELNDDLPDEVVSSEYIDDLMVMFEEMDIMVIDEATKEEIEKTRKLKKKQEKAPERDSLRTEISDGMTRVSDPVKMYLKEMGCISLLTREGEVEIAKRIESGEEEALSALLRCCVGIEYIVELGQRLRDGEIKLKDVINDLEDEDSHAQIGEKRDSIINLIDEIGSLYKERCDLKREVQKRGIVAATEEKMRRQDRKRLRKHRGTHRVVQTGEEPTGSHGEQAQGDLPSIAPLGKGNRGMHSNDRGQDPVPVEKMSVPGPQVIEGHRSGQPLEDQETRHPFRQIQD